MGPSSFGAGQPVGGCEPAPSGRRSSATGGRLGGPGLGATTGDGKAGGETEGGPLGNRAFGAAEPPVHPSTGGGFILAPTSGGLPRSAWSTESSSVRGAHGLQEAADDPGVSLAGDSSPERALMEPCNHVFLVSPPRLHVICTPLRDDVHGPSVSRGPWTCPPPPPGGIDHGPTNERGQLPPEARR